MVQDWGAHDGLPVMDAPCCTAYMKKAAPLRALALVELVEPRLHLVERLGSALDIAADFFRI